MVLLTLLTLYHLLGTEVCVSLYSRFWSGSAEGGCSKKYLQCWNQVCGLLCTLPLPLVVGRGDGERCEALDPISYTFRSTSSLCCIMRRSSSVRPRRSISCRCASVRPRPSISWRRASRIWSLVRVIGVKGAMSMFVLCVPNVSSCLVLSRNQLRRSVRRRASLASSSKTGVGVRCHGQDLERQVQSCFRIQGHEVSLVGLGRFLGLGTRKQSQVPGCLDLRMPR
jgi:hypothetical protein